MRRLFLCLTLTMLSLAPSITAQEYNELYLVRKPFEQCHEKSSRESFKGQILKGKRNGMGYLVSRNETLYVGDFANNAISGYGLQIATNGISNCADARYYVGGWQGGRKSGFGVCYTTTGDIIYAGNFANDKPTDSYPSASKSTRRFAIINFSKYSCYIGEIKEGVPDGFGTLVLDNGDLWQGSFKNGRRSGIGLYLCYDGEWETINIKGEEATMVSSSVEYRAIDDARKAALRAYRQSIREEFSTWLGEISTLMLEYQAMYNAKYATANGSTADSTSGNYDSDDTSSSNKSEGTTCPDCNGCKYDSKAYTYAAGSAGGVRQPYHHTGGSGCPYCSSTSDHYHYPCAECMGKGKVYW